MRSAVSTSPIASEVMLDTLANAANPIRDEKRQALLREEGRLLALQGETNLLGPDLDLMQGHYTKFERNFWK